MIVDVLRQTDDENEIYCLLTAYIDATRFYGKCRFISERTLRLPVEGVADIESRFAAVVADLDRASKALDDAACLALREALHVFGTALHRLQSMVGRYRVSGSRGGEAAADHPVEPAGTTLA